MPRESTIQILRSTSTDTPTGLTFGELAYSDVNGKLFVGRTGGASLWVGTGITTGSISTNSATLVPTQSAVKTYVDGVVGGGSVVNSLNGTGGAITITGDGGSQLVTVSGTTTTLSNRLASATVTGVASFGNEFVVTSGAVGLTSNYTKSINGLTGALGLTVSGNLTLTMTGADNKTFRLYSKPYATVKGTAGAIAWADTDAIFEGDGVDLGADNAFKFNYLTDLSLQTPGSFKLGTLYSDSFIQFGDGTTQGTAAKPLPLASSSVTGVASFGNEFVVTSGAVGLTSNYVKSFNGSTGAVSFAVPLASSSVTGVASFNATRFTVSGAGAVDLATAFQVTGDRVVAGNAITATRSGNSVTVDNNGVRSFNGSTGAVSFAVPLASSSVTGVASFGNEFVVTSGAVGLTSNYVKSVNGLTGAVVSIATTGSNVFTGLNTFNAGISGTSATFSGDIAVNGGDITTSSATATVFNTTTTNLSIGSAATTLTMGATSGGSASIRNPTLTLGNTTSTITTNALNGNNLTVAPYGSVNISPSNQILSDGTQTTLVVTNDLDGAGQVQIAGGDLYLNRKSVNGAVFTPVNIIFEGGSLDTNETTLTCTKATTDRTITLPDASGIVALTNTTVASINGFTGAVQVTGSGAITQTVSGTTTTFGARLASATVTGVASFGNEFVVTSGAVGLTSNYVKSFNGSTGAVSFVVPLASTSVTGVASFNSTRFTVSGVGAVDLAAAFQVTGDTVVAGNAITATRSGNSVTVANNGVRSFNGATGAITITGAGAITYTQSGTSNTINARLATTSLTGVAYFDSTNFTAAADGKVSITASTITNAQLVNSSISFAGGGSPSSVSLGGTLTITGTANEVKVTNSGSGTLTLGLPTDVVIGGNLTVNGTVITANVENFVVEDPLIALGTGNAADSVDLGWYGMYTSGSLRYAGTFRDASDGGKFKFFGGLTAQPSATINTSAATYATATIVANIDGGTF